jgi:toxin CptA
MVISLKILICVPVIAATVYFIAQDALLRLPWSLVAIDLNHNGQLYVMDVRGRKYAASVLPGSFVAAYLSVINFRLDGDDAGTALRRRNCLLIPQRVDRDAFRKLRVWLRWHSEKIPESE